jgi:hypothetical protein
VLSGEISNANFLVFGLTKLGLLSVPLKGEFPNLILQQLNRLFIEK